MDHNPAGKRLRQSLYVQLTPATVIGNRAATIAIAKRTGDLSQVRLTRELDNPKSRKDCSTRVKPTCRSPPGARAFDQPAFMRALLAKETRQ
jgi:hypothetical protein